MIPPQTFHCPHCGAPWTNFVTRRARFCYETDMGTNGWRR